MRNGRRRKTEGVNVLLAVLLLAGGACVATATDYYVKGPAQGGSDAADGLDWTTAKATIGAAMALADGDDTVRVGAGTYAERVTFPGASNNELLGGYPAAGGGTQEPWTNTTVIDGNGLGGTVVYVPADMSSSRGYSGIVIDGLTIRNGSESGAGGGGIESYSTGLTITRCIVENNQNSGVYAGGIYVVGLLNEYSSRVLRIEECIIRNNTGPNAGGLMFDAIGYVGFEIKNTLVHGNHCTTTSGLYGIGGLALGTGSQGLALPANVINCTIANNTAAHPTAPVGGIAVNADLGNPVTIKNSIIWHSSLDDLYTQGYSSFSLSYCCVHDAGDSGTGVIHTSPSFVGGVDYHLTTGSGGCIDGGAAAGAPSTDLEGNSRPLGAGYDMGAYEFDTPPANVTSLVAVPGNGKVDLSWTNPADADFAGVKVQRKTGSYASGLTDGTTVYDDNGTSTTDTNLTNGTQYYYTAFSYDTGMNYASGAQASATPAMPTWHVDVTSGNDANTGFSWGNAFQTITQAVAVAEEGEEIWVKAGTYPLDAGYNGKIGIYGTSIGLYGGFDGTETSRSNRNWRLNETIIDGQDQVWSCVRIQDADETVVDGFTITRGSTYTDGSGAGISVYDCTPTIRNCIISDCHAQGLGSGGGIQVNGNDGAPTVANCLIENCSAYSGGAIHLYSANVGPTKLVNCTLSGNTTAYAPAGNSGTIHVNNSALNVDNTVIWGNTVTPGDPHIYSSSRLSDINVNYSDVEGGWAGGGTGNLNVYPRFMGTGAYRLQFA